MPARRRAPRLPGIDERSIEQRETQSGLLARRWYLGTGADLPPWKQRVLAEVRRSVRPIEPPILDYLSALQFRLGGENFWFPRLLSSLAWVLGGIFLYLIATRLTTPDGAVIALALYLAWPFAVWLGRHFMPDALMVFCLLAAVLAVVRHWELPSRQRFLVAAAVSSLATLIKPGVAFAYLVAVFAALAVSRRGLRALPRWGGQLAGFAALAALPALAYYVAGTRLADFIDSSADTARLTPGWWDAVSYLLRYPQPQELLAVLPLAAALGGFALVRSGPRRALLGGLGLGYLAFAWTFATYTSANPYYSLPLIPILALAIGVLGGATAERLRRLSTRAPYAPLPRSWPLSWASPPTRATPSCACRSCQPRSQTTAGSAS